MEIRLFLWRRADVAKLAARGIEPEEVEEPLAVDAWVPTTRPQYPGQVRIIGPTRRGRFLTVALDPTDDPAVWRPITGWEATTDERAYHWEETR
jgi:hypothetical protein